MGYLSGGAYLGGTGSANHLQDYEEGTWTPIWSGAGSPTYSSQVGTYTKVGNRVHISCYLQISNKGTMTGAVEIGGLPYTSSNVTNNYQAVTVWINTTVSGQLFDGDYYIQAYLAPNYNKIIMQSLDGDGTVANLDASHLNNNSDIMISVSYKA